MGQARRERRRLVGMSSDTQERAANQTHPVIAADATGISGVFDQGLTGALQSFLLPDSMKGHWLEMLHSNSGSVQYGFSFGAAAAGITIDQDSTPGAGHVNSAFPLPSSGRSGRIPYSKLPVYLNIKSAAAGGRFYGYVSDYTG